MHPKQRWPDGLFHFLKNREHFEAIIARVNAVRALERTNDQRGGARRHRHGTGINHENAIGRRRVGRNRCGESVVTNSAKQRQPENHLFHNVLEHGSSEPDLRFPSRIFPKGIETVMPFT